MRRPGTVGRILGALGALVLGILVGGTPAEADLQVLRAEGYPLFLVYREGAEGIAGATLRTPAGIHPLREVEGLKLAAVSQARSREDRDLTEDLLWKLTFHPRAKGQTGVQVWIGHLTSLPKVWVVVAPVGATQWDTMTTTLKVPRGTAVYVAPQMPSYGRLAPYGGREALTFVYTIRLTPQGPAFVPVPEVYRQLAEHQDTVIRGEYDPLKRLAYQRQKEDYLRIAAGKAPSVEAVRSFPWKKILSVEWRP